MFLSYKAQYRTPVVWKNVYYIIVFHILGIIGTCYIPYAKWGTLLALVIFNIISLLGITAGAHRLWSHRSYKVRLPLRLFLIMCNSMAFQNSAYVWARDHRLHHKFVDTDADPYNSSRGFFFAHIGWLMCKKHPDVRNKGKTVDFSDLHNDRLLMFQHRNFYKLAFIFTVIIPTVIPVYLFGERPLISFLICFALKFVFMNHSMFLINSAAHLYGTRPYDKTMNPRENNLVAWFTLGEGFHNYHHTFPKDYATSEWGFTLNLTKMFIDLMALAGQAYDRKIVTPKMIKDRSLRTGELAERIDEQKVESRDF